MQRRGLNEGQVTAGERKWRWRRGDRIQWFRSGAQEVGDGDHAFSKAQMADLSH